jgi:hypothetical protein
MTSDATVMMSRMRAVLIKDGQGPIENLYIGETDKPVATKVRAFLHLIDLRKLI